MSQHDQDLKELVRQARAPDEHFAPSFEGMLAAKPARSRWKPVVLLATVFVLGLGFWFAANDTEPPTEPMPDIASVDPDTTELTEAVEASDWELAESPTAFLAETATIESFDTFETPTDFLAVDVEELEEL